MFYIVSIAFPAAVRYRDGMWKKAEFRAVRSGLLAVVAASALWAAPAFAGAVTTNVEKWITTIDTGDSGAGLGSGPFGTVEIDLNSTTGSKTTANQAIILVTLTNGELWANTSNHEDFAFNVSSRLRSVTPTVSAPFPYQFDAYSSTKTYKAGGIGNFAEGVDCSGCAGGTSGNYKGVLSLTYSFAGGLLITDFLDLNGNACSAGNASNCFAVDVGVPDGKGGFTTGAAAAAKPMRRIPEPATAALVAGVLAMLGWARRRRA
jgi:hypothetical protein